MRASVKFRIESAAIAALSKRLAEIDRKAARKAIKDGINEATKSILADAKALVRERTGQLRRSLGRKVRSVRGGAVVYGVIKPRAGRWVSIKPGEMGPFHGRVNAAGTKRFKSFRKKFDGLGFVNPVHYAHLVEYGRGPVVAGTRKGKRTGKKVLSGGGVIYGRRVRAAPPHPFLRPAWERNKARVTGEIIRHLHLELKKFRASARTRYGRRAA